MVIFLIFECFFSKRFFVLLFIQNIIVFTLPALIIFCVHHLVVFSQTNMFKLIESWKFQAFGFHKVASLNAKLEVNNRGVLGEKVILEMVAQNSQENTCIRVCEFSEIFSEHLFSRIPLRATAS